VAQLPPAHVLHAAAPLTEHDMVMFAVVSPAAALVTAVKAFVHGLS
jgi:hypothetical protein